jgi:hypothetical protein
MGALAGVPEINLPPPPVRSTRYRRLSADAGAVRQFAMMQAAGAGPGQQQQSAELATDLVGMRGSRLRNDVWM